MNDQSESRPDPVPSEWPVLITGAGGFVGGHIARHLARAGHPVRGLARERMPGQRDHSGIDWIIGDLRDPALRVRAVEGMRAVIHAAGWVSLGSDRRRLSHEINVVATGELIEEARRRGVQRFVYTSTLHTLAAGTATAPADEATPWNLQCVDSPYCRSKRLAEQIICGMGDDGFETIVLCPGMVVGPGTSRPTSMRLLHALARTPIAVVPRGGIPIIDADVLALAHRRALTSGRSGERYAVVGPYLSYLELARLVSEVAGRPRVILAAVNGTRAPLILLARLAELLRLETALSTAAVAGGFLALHVSGRRADACFRLQHPSPLETIRAALDSPAQL